MNLFGVGAPEAGVILLIALILIGPQNFPQVMRQAGRWYRVARAFSNEVMKDVRSAVDEIEQEVKRDAGDLESIRELTNLDGDLRQVKTDIAAVGQETSRVARGDDMIAPREMPAPAPPRPKGWWEDRDPNDPFVKLERERAAAREAALAARAAKAADAATPAASSPDAAAGTPARSDAADGNGTPS
ncbi:MAG: hypothetical protein AMXMBFR23_07400 [Chloroflexota bacterium]